MAAAFIGLSVKVLLNNGMSLKGHVADVDQITQRLMLQDGEAALSFNATALWRTTTCQEYNLRTDVISIFASFSRG